jgi:hypothetical protein
LELCHPGPSGSAQGDLFKYAIDRRHGRADEIPESLVMIRANRMFRDTMREHSSVLLDSRALKDAGMTWEDALSLSGPVIASPLNKVTKAVVWEAMIPSMGYMALLRNLRNFDEAEISDAAVDDVVARLTDPGEVWRSRQFPYRFLSAHASVASSNWSRALDKALTLATANIPALPGRTLVMVDTSASMRGTVSAKSSVQHVDVASLFGVTLAARGCDVDLIGFANGWFRHTLPKGTLSVLGQSAKFIHRVGEVGHGTNTAEALSEAYDGHSRVVIIHDGQYGSFRYGWQNLSTVVPPEVPMFSVDTSGYAASPLDTSMPNRYEIGGFSDRLFTMVDFLSRGRSAPWPWEA